MTQENEVIRRVLQGDVESFRLLVQRYEKPVVRMAGNLTGDRESGRDIAQDVFLAAYKKLSSFDPACSNFSTWLFTITRNKSINALRRKRLRSQGKLREKVNRHHASDELAREEFYRRLDRALDALPQAQKRAFVLAEFEQLPYAQIAQIEGVRAGTVKSRINRAKAKLRLALKDYAGGVV